MTAAGVAQLAEDDPMLLTELLCGARDGSHPGRFRRKVITYRAVLCAALECEHKDPSCLCIAPASGGRPHASDRAVLWCVCTPEK